MAEDKKVVTKKTAKKAPAAKKTAAAAAITKKTVTKKTVVKKTPSARSATPAPAITKKTLAKKALAKKTIAPAPAPTAPVPKGTTRPPLPDRAVALKPVGKVAPEERYRMIQEAAYYRAEKRGFEPGREDEDWAAAVAEIDAMLGGG